MGFVSGAAATPGGTAYFPRDFILMTCRQSSKSELLVYENGRRMDAAIIYWKNWSPGLPDGNALRTRFTWCEPWSRSGNYEAQLSTSSLGYWLNCMRDCLWHPRALVSQRGVCDCVL